jgi:trk system potassium uptake protein TrkH
MLHRIRRSTFRRLTPSRIFILSFALLILIGAVMLRMPFASSGSRLSFVDALFTAASAVCVTGLAGIDIGKDLSFAGQVITCFRSGDSVSSPSP